jgi:hypothetical protein
MFESIGLHAALILNRLRTQAQLTAVDEQRPNQDGREDRHEQQRSEHSPCAGSQAVDQRLDKKPSTEIEGV